MAGEGEVVKTDGERQEQLLFFGPGTLAGALWLWLHKPFIEALLPLSCQANPPGWRAPLIPLQENGTEDINQDYYTGPCLSQGSASYHKIAP